MSQSWRKKKSQPGLFDEWQSATLAQRLLQENPKQLGPALARAANAKLNEFINGIERYRTHPYRRTLKDPPAVWRESGSRLLDYGGEGPPVLFVPSLINRAYVLDLDRERSMLRWMAQERTNPLLLDWGEPHDRERRYSMSSYVLRLVRALEAFGEPVHLVGYCMGGNIALAAAQRRPDLVKSLAFMATPWDFHAEGKDTAIRSARIFRNWKAACTTTGTVPVDLLQVLFTLLDPIGSPRKFCKFSSMTDEEEIRRFIAVEDWLNDGIPLPLHAAEDCMIGWYERNAPASNLWLVDGEPVNPAKIDIPSLVIVPELDRIVPPASSAALADALPRRSKVTIPMGHVGMIVGSDARYYTWSRIANWVRRWR